MKSYLFKLFFIIIMITTNSKSFSGDDKFIKVNSSHFEFNGKPYYFIGTNFWYGCYLGSSGKVGNQERLIRELDRLKEIGITNLRILAASESSYIKKSLTPVIQVEPEIYNEELLDGLDFLIYEMSKREMHAVVILTNYWEWSGGFAAYNYWTKFGEAIDPYDSSQAWDKFMDYTSSFYQNEKGNLLFKKYLEKVINRKNKYTERYYYEEPTIMAWQLANEPRPGSGEQSIANQKFYYDWINETAKYIKSLDQNHLVSTGSEGVIGNLQIDSIYIKAHQSNYIDYLTFHLWAKNWNWYDAKNPEETFPIAVKNAMEYFNHHLILARKIGKPIIMEEFGLGRDGESYDINSSTNYRDKYFNLILSALYDSIKAGAPIAGVNFWAWAGEGRNKNADYIWKNGDDFTGDPPHEPQGLNSIFDVDKTTIQIIKDNISRINALIK